MLNILAEQLAKAESVLPPEVLDYYASGAGEELTLSESVDAWTRFRLRPWPLRDVSSVDTSVKLLNDDFGTPIAAAPSAFHKLAHADAERASIAGTAAAGALFVLSTRASLPIAEIGSATTSPWWFQVYVMRDRDVTARIAEDAVAAGARAIVLTGDTPYVGRKRRVNGVRIPMPDDHYLVNISRHLPVDVDGRDAAAQDPSIGLECIEWLKGLTGLPVLVKGVLREDAAADCVEAGAAGVIVSNHGGRQLDRAIPSALALEAITSAIGHRVPVLVDGGLRSGVDVLTALALGARAVLVGRPVLWGLAADGADGVRAAIDELTGDLRHALALAGVRRLDDVRRDLVLQI